MHILWKNGRSEASVSSPRHRPRAVPWLRAHGVLLSEAQSLLPSLSLQPPESWESTDVSDGHTVSPRAWLHFSSRGLGTGACRAHRPHSLLPTGPGTVAAFLSARPPPERMEVGVPCALDQGPWPPRCSLGWAVVLQSLGAAALFPSEWDVHWGTLLGRRRA